MGELLIRRMMLQAAEGGEPQPVLPSDYQEVEYIQTPGTVALTTALKFPKTAIVITGSFSFSNSVTREQYLICDRDSGGVKLCVASKCTGGVASAFAFTGIKANYDSTAVAENICTFTASFSGSGSNTSVTLKGTLNGESFNETATGTSRVYGNNNIKFFDANGSTRLVGKMLGRLTITNPDGLVYCFVPCYRKSDDAVGVFETQTESFYTNANLTKGSDV